MKLTLGQIADWIHAEGDFTTSAEALGYSIDSRTLSAGELFFAIKGERDGHDYVATALANGAVAAVVSTHWLAPDEMDLCRLLWVPESEDCVLKAMQTVARQVRRQWGKRVIGVTGSGGKTTTKEAIATVLSARFRTFRSAGNLNNHLGVPLQLLRLEPEDEVAVIEMGMNHPGEIATLCRIAEPDWGVVSNVGPAHIEFFPDGIEGIASAKKELLDSLPAGGLGFVNADDPRVAAMAAGPVGWTAVRYGRVPEATVRAEEIVADGMQGTRFTVVAGAERASVGLQLMGHHNVLNALAAIAVGLSSGIPLEECAATIATLEPSDKRGSIVHWRGATIVNDCYNSNPAALNAMVDALMAIPAARHIVIAGEMLELGTEGARLHHECGQHMAARGVDAIVGVRGLAREFGGTFLDTPQAAGEWMAAHLREGDAVLLKASRGVRLEAALAALNAG